MNQTGVRSTCSRRAARTSDGSTRATLPVAGAVHLRYLPGPAEPDRARAGGVAPEHAQLERALGERQPGVAVGGRHADVDEEPPLAHRQAGEVEPEPLESPWRKAHALQRLRAHGPAVGVADADGDARALGLLLGGEPHPERPRLALDEAVAHGAVPSHRAHLVDTAAGRDGAVVARRLLGRAADDAAVVRAHDVRRR